MYLLQIFATHFLHKLITICDVGQVFAYSYKQFIIPANRSDSCSTDTMSVVKVIAFINLSTPMRKNCLLL